MLLLEIDHYARYCYFNKEYNASDKEEAQFSHVGNNHEVMLINNTHLAQDKTRQDKYLVS